MCGERGEREGRARLLRKVTAIRRFEKKKSEESAKLQPAAPAKASALKTVALIFAAPFIGLAYVVIGPIVGLGLLIWFGIQAWGKLGAKALASRPDTK